MLLEISPRETCAIGVFLSALLTAWNTNVNGFVWDDRSAVLSNKDVQSSSLLEVFSHDFWGTHIQSSHSHKSYRPLTVLSFRLNYMMAKGHSAWLYHFTNTFVHASCSVLVWKVADVLFQQHERQKKAFQATKKPQETSPSVETTMEEVVIRQENGSLVGPVTTGLLFAVHPIHSDAVASIVGRADLLCTLLSLSAFLVFVKSGEETNKSRLYMVLALVLTIAAGLCKELGFTTFALLALYDLLRLQQSRRVEKKSRVMTQRLAITAGVGLFVAAVRVWINGEHRQMEWNILANNVVVQKNRLTRILSYTHGHAWYLWKLLWPRWLCFDYGYNTIPVITSIADPRNGYTLLAYMAVAIVLYGAILQLRGSSKTPPSSLFMMSFTFGVVPFVPASNVLFPVGTVVAERLMYFPSVGVCLLVGCVIDQAFLIMDKYIACTTQRSPMTRDKRTAETASCLCYQKNIFNAVRIVVLTCGTLLLIAGCYRSYQRNADWASEQTLFKAAVSVVPSNVKVLSNEAKNLLNTDPAKALDYLRVAIGMIPKHIESQTNAGLAFIKLAAVNNFDEDLFLHGIRHLFKSATLAPKHPQALGFIGSELYAHWVSTRRQNGDISAGEFLGSESIASATHFLEQAIDNNSVYPTHFYHRASIAFEKGDFDTAIAFFHMTEVANSIIRERKLDPELIVESSSIYNMLGVSFKKKGEVDKALEMLQKGISLDPHEMDLHVNAALILQQEGNHDDAETHLKAGLMTATASEHALNLRIAAELFETSGMFNAVEAYLNRAAELERTCSDSPQCNE